jgi:hypothetical protein
LAYLGSAIGFAEPNFLLRSRSSQISADQAHGLPRAPSLLGRALEERRAAMISATSPEAQDQCDLGFEAIELPSGQIDAYASYQNRQSLQPLAKIA